MSIHLKTIKKANYHFYTNQSHQISLCILNHLSLPKLKKELLSEGSNTRGIFVIWSCNQWTWNLKNNLFLFCIPTHNHWLERKKRTKSTDFKRNHLGKNKLKMRICMNSPLNWSVPKIKLPYGQLESNWNCKKNQNRWKWNFKNNLRRNLIQHWPNWSNFLE